MTSTCEPLRDLLSRLRHQMLRILWRYGVPERDAEDVLQDTLVLFLEKRGEVRDPEAWLTSTLRNQSIMYQRRRRSVLGQSLEPGNEPRPEQNPIVEGGQRQTEARLLLEKALRELPARQRATVLLRHVEGFSAREVAPRIGCRPNSVRVLLRRARRKLRAALQGNAPAPASRRLVESRRWG